MYVIHRTFSTWNEPAIFYNRRAHVLFHVLRANCAYFGVRFLFIGVEFVLGTKRTLKRNLLCAELRISIIFCSLLAYTQIETEKYMSEVLYKTPTKVRFHKH